MIGQTTRYIVRYSVAEDTNSAGSDGAQRQHDVVDEDLDA